MEQATFFYSQIRRQLCLRHVRMSSNPDLAALQDGLQCTDRRFNPWTEVCAWQTDAISAECQKWAGD